MQGEGLDWMKYEKGKYYCDSTVRNFELTSRDHPLWTAVAGRKKRGGAAENVVEGNKVMEEYTERS